MLKKLFSICLCVLVAVLSLSPQATYAGNLVTNAKIIRLASSSNGSSDDFFIEVEGGSGPCANGTIIFPRSLSPSDGFFNRMFAIALTAYTTQSVNVRAFTPAGTGCGTASFIEISE